MIDLVIFILFYTFSLASFQVHGITYDADVHVVSYRKEGADITIRGLRNVYHKKYVVNVYNVDFGCLVGHGLHSLKEPVKGGEFRMRIPTLACSGSFDIMVTPSNSYLENGRPVFPCYDPNLELDRRSRECPESITTIELVAKKLKDCERMRKRDVCRKQKVKLRTVKETTNLPKSVNNANDTSTTASVEHLSSPAPKPDKDSYQHPRYVDNKSNNNSLQSLVYVMIGIEIFIAIVLVFILLSFSYVYFQVRSRYRRVNESHV